MQPKQAWGAFSIIVIVVDAAAAALLIDLAYEPVLVATAALIALLIYFYVLYKRYHVEVVPESDLAQFEDPDDLRILSSIYGLDTKGTETELRARLLDFANAHRGNAFVWVAPKFVQLFGATLEIPDQRTAPRTALKKSLLGPAIESGGRARPKRCPICDAGAPEKGSTCSECGADLEFYVALAGTKVGRLMLLEKAGEVRRKLRYEVPSLREKR